MFRVTESFRKWSTVGLQDRQKSLPLSSSSKFLPNSATRSAAHTLLCLAQGQGFLAQVELLLVELLIIIDAGRFLIKNSKNDPCQ